MLEASILLSIILCIVLIQASLLGSLGASGRSVHQNVAMGIGVENENVNTTRSVLVHVRVNAVNLNIASNGVVKQRVCGFI